MKARESNFVEKVSNYMQSKNLKPSDLYIDIAKSEQLMAKRGHYPLTIAKSFDFAATEQYKKAREEHPDFSPGPTSYWKMKLGQQDTNTKPIPPESATVNGKEVKVYYLNRRRTDNIIAKPMRKSVF